MSQITGRVAEIPNDRTVYVMCHSGARSAQVAQWLNLQGFDAVNVAGGILAWAGNGRPVVA
jgi:rhodanese-related sulfurtransferase